ncbi:MAG TPA: hypothetical protein VMH39_08225 [Gemmatimonadaceae bacterium]|nr:hypothetical protein [Gemmatimonadaceae bacterium]
MLRMLVAGRWAVALALGAICVSASGQAALAQYGRDQYGPTQYRFAWGIVTTGLGVSGSGFQTRSDLVEIGRLGAGLRLNRDYAIQVTATATSRLSNAGSGGLDERPVEPNLAGVTAALDFMSTPRNGELGPTVSLGLGGFRHRGGSSNGTTDLGFQFTADDGVVSIPYVGDLATGAMITVLPESGSRSEFIFGLTFGLRLY